MNKHNGMSDTRKIPIPQTPPEPTGLPPEAGSNLNLPAGHVPAPRQPQYRTGGVPQPRPSIMQQNAPRSTGMNRGQQHTSTIPRQRRITPPPPQAGLRRASWEGNFPDEPMVPPDDPFYEPEPAPAPVYAQPPEFQDEEYNVPKRKKKRRKKKHSCLRKIIFSILGFLFTIFAIYSIIAIIAIRKIQRVETGERHFTANAPEPDSKVRNLLLIGSTETGNEKGFADTIILLSFSSYNGTLTLTSMLPDSYVNIPGYGARMLGAAHSYGGPTLLMDTITNNFGIRVDEFLSFNFKSFVEIVDAVGGFKMKLSDIEAGAINDLLKGEINTVMGENSLSDLLPSGGTFVLNGKQVLSYARMKLFGKGNADVSDRKQVILNLLLDKLKLMRPTTIFKILGKAMPDLTTNIGGGRMYWDLLKLPFQLIHYDKQSLRLPADGTFQTQTSPDGQQVLAVDFNSNRSLYQEAVTKDGGLKHPSTTERESYGTQERIVSASDDSAGGNRCTASDVAAANVTADADALQCEAQPQNPETLSRNTAGGRLPADCRTDRTPQAGRNNLRPANRLVYGAAA